MTARPPITQLFATVVQWAIDAFVAQCRETGGGA